MKNKTASVLSLMMAIVLLCSVITDAHADNKSYSCELTKSIDQTAKEWMANETSRALVTVLLVFDLLLTENIQFDDYNLNESIVACTDGTITVGVAGQKNSLIIFYNPLFKHAEYTTISQSSFLGLYYILSSNSDEAYENDRNALSQVVDLLGDMLN